MASQPDLDELVQDAENTAGSLHLIRPVFGAGEGADADHEAIQLEELARHPRQLVAERPSIHSGEHG